MNPAKGQPSGQGGLIIPLDAKFVSNGKNYTNPGQGSCIVCQDYSEIDLFAQSVSLQKLQPLRESMLANLPSTIAAYNPKQFDATTLFHRLEALNIPSGSIADPLPAYLAVELKKIQGKQENLLDLFSDYATFRFKNPKDWEDYIKKVEEEINSLRTQSGNAASADEKAKIGAQLSAKKKAKIVEFAVGWWIFYTHGPEKIQAVAQALWLSLVTIKSREHAYDHNRDDPVAKARLVYSWLAHSVSYDENLAKDILADKVPAGNRLWASTLATGKEVCLGYAELFRNMYDGIKDEDSPESRTIVGVVRLSGGPQDTLRALASSVHAWNAFPIGLNQSRPNGIEYKVIDPTWAAVDARGYTNPAWWSMTNESFLMSHNPDSNENTCTAVATDKAREKIWSDTQPTYTPRAEQYWCWIDRSTIKPDNTKITRDGDSKVTVSFGNNCVHQRTKKMADFFLGFADSHLALDEFLKQPFWIEDKEPAPAPFKLVQDHWEASLKIPYKSNGFVLMYVNRAGATGLPNSTKCITLYAWTVSPQSAALPVQKPVIPVKKAVIGQKPSGKSGGLPQPDPKGNGSAGTQSRRSGVSIPDPLQLHKQS